MKDILLFIFGAVVLFIILKIFAQKKPSGKMQSDFMNIVKTDEFSALSKTPEFRSLLTTKEFEVFLGNLAKDQFIDISKNLLSTDLETSNTDEV